MLSLSKHGDSGWLPCFGTAAATAWGRCLDLIFLVTHFRKIKK
jgi:hypothetical protein